MERWLITDEDEMPPELDGAIRKGLCAAFPADAEVYANVRAWHDSWPAFSVTLRDGDAVACHVAIVDRIVLVGGRPHRVAGPQNVFVSPEFRGRGLAAGGMAAAMGEARRRGILHGLLFCLPVLRKVYHPLGWADAGDREVVRVEEGEEKSLPAKNVCLHFALGDAPFPDGDIHLCGNDW